VLSPYFQKRSLVKDQACARLEDKGTFMPLVYILGEPSAASFVPWAKAFDTLVSSVEKAVIEPLAASYLKTLDKCETHVNEFTALSQSKDAEKVSQQITHLKSEIANLSDGMDRFGTDASSPLLGGTSVNAGEALVHLAADKSVAWGLATLLRRPGTMDPTSKTGSASRIKVRALHKEHLEDVTKTTGAWLHLAEGDRVLAACITASQSTLQYPICL
jgi:hypothetical protein